MKDKIENISKKRVLSGIRASGRLHLGNYFGMVKGMLELQKDPHFEPLFMVADLHAMTTPFKPDSLKKDVKEVVLDYLAAGLDPKKSVVFVQSHIPEHIELSYLFSTVISIARLGHLPTYKEKVKQYPQHNTLALLYYPILQASDILIYKTQLLPVGDDQLPHLEIAREIAKKMNEIYRTDFPFPEQLKTEGHSIPSLTGEGKMSKSVPGSYINLTDDLETIKQRLAGVPTDSGKGKIVTSKYINENGQESKGVGALIQFVELFQGKNKREEYEKAYISEGIRYSDLKEELAEAIFSNLRPIQEKRKELEKKPEYVGKVIEDGAKKARKIAQETLREVKEKMGLL